MKKLLNIKASKTGDQHSFKSAKDHFAASQAHAKAADAIRHANNLSSIAGD